jgi:hypothetical protein
MRIMLLMVAAAFIPAQLVAFDFESCRDDLDSLRKLSAEASDAAADGQSKRDDYEECRRDPADHDPMGDGCQSQRSDYESAVSDLQKQNGRRGAGCAMFNHRAGTTSR